MKIDDEYRGIKVIDFDRRAAIISIGESGFIAAFDASYTMIDIWKFVTEERVFCLDQYFDLNHRSGLHYSNNKYIVRFSKTLSVIDVADIFK